MSSMDWFSLEFVITIFVIGFIVMMIVSWIISRKSGRRKERA